MGSQGPSALSSVCVSGRSFFVSLLRRKPPAQDSRHKKHLEFPPQEAPTPTSSGFSGLEERQEEGSRRPGQLGTGKEESEDQVAAAAGHLEVGAEAGSGPPCGRKWKVQTGF
jgi:hypothetical protein